MAIHDDSSLKGRIAMISGAMGSIGQAIALELARRGASVAMADINDAADVEGLVEQLNSFGVASTYRRVDVSRREQVEPWICSVEADFGVADIIIPCAAIVTRMGIREVDAASWQNELNINLNGAFYLAQGCALRMAGSGKPGSIVFVGSWAAERPHPRIVTYCVSKAALRMLMRCMAMEFAPQGIVINEVAPGYVDAGLTGKTLQADPARRKDLIDKTPAGRLIQADEVAYHVANMCEPASSGLTGTTLLLDGGASLRTP